jgi:hypothetical protein
MPDHGGTSPTPHVTSPSQDLEATSGSSRLWGAGGITAGALILLGLKLWVQTRYPAVSFDDAVSVGLLVVAVLPWLSQLLASAKLPGGWELVFRELKDHQDQQGDLLLQQQAQINALRAAVRGIVTRYEYDKLLGLSREGPFLCTYSDDMRDELRRLRALGLIWHHDGTGIAKMERDHRGKTQPFDVKHYFYITDEGRTYVEMRRKADDDGALP